MHFASVVILIYKIHATRSCRGQPFLLQRCVFENSQCLMSNVGISFKSQALYAVVFFARYLDYFDGLVQIYEAIVCSSNVYYPYSISGYAMIGKTLLLTSSCYILYLMKFRYRSVLPHSLYRILFLLISTADKRMIPQSIPSVPTMSLFLA